MAENQERSASPAISRSPSQRVEEPAKVDLDFAAALRLVLAGEKLTRAAWKSTELYMRMESNWLMLYKPDDEPGGFIIHELDLTAHDWQVVTEQNDEEGR